jgi:hypothetical protein
MTEATALELELLRLRLDALVSSRRHGGLTAAERAEHRMLCDRERKLLDGR